jgi:hypothetical protein
MELLLEALADIERQMDDAILPHSDQQLLDLAWEDIYNQIEAMERGEEDDDETIESDSDSIHTQPKRFETPQNGLIDIGNGMYVTTDELDALHEMGILDDSDDEF